MSWPEVMTPCGTVPPLSSLPRCLQPVVDIITAFPETAKPHGCGRSASNPDAGGLVRSGPLVRLTTG